VLIQTRRLILEGAGHRVIAATSEAEVAVACQQHRFDVAVIGQTISNQQKTALFSLVQKHCPSAKILELYLPSQGRALERANEWLLVPVDVPSQLAERVNELAKQT